MSKHESSHRAAAREAAKRKRLKKREWRNTILDLVAFGHPYEQIAEKAGVSVSTIRRHIAEALRQRPPEPADTFVALQRERLNKALQYTDLAIERGDLRAVATLVTLLPQIERYWGLQHALRHQRAEPAAAQLSAPNPLKSLQAEMRLPPLAAAPEIQPPPPFSGKGEG